MQYTKEQIRAGKKLVEYFQSKRVPIDEARQRTVEILAEHSPERIMRALSDQAVSYKVENLYAKLNFKKLRHLNK